MIAGSLPGVAVPALGAAVQQHPRQGLVGTERLGRAGPGVGTDGRGDVHTGVEPGREQQRHHDDGPRRSGSRDDAADLGLFDVDVGLPHRGLGNRGGERGANPGDDGPAGEGAGAVGAGDQGGHGASSW